MSTTCIPTPWKHTRPWKLPTIEKLVDNISRYAQIIKQVAQSPRVPYCYRVRFAGLTADTIFSLAHLPTPISRKKGCEEQFVHEADSTPDATMVVAPAPVAPSPERFVTIFLAEQASRGLVMESLPVLFPTLVWVSCGRHTLSRPLAGSKTHDRVGQVKHVVFPVLES